MLYNLVVVTDHVVAVFMPVPVVASPAVGTPGPGSPKELDKAFVIGIEAKKLLAV
ncbi:MAG: hypothetical protein HYW02_01210 [Deltaproteobacteria bacterium]|nr:hypothetical protein [Deltaproteobacteria bacterium]